MQECLSAVVIRRLLIDAVGLTSQVFYVGRGRRELALLVVESLVLARQKVHTLCHILQVFAVLHSVDLQILVLLPNCKAISSYF